MFKDYYNYKKKNKRIRWVYDRETSEWKREPSPQYSERYLNHYLFLWILLIGFLFTLILLFFNLPFTNQLRFKILSSPLLVFIWLLYVILMNVSGVFIKRFFRAVIMCSIISTIVFFASDMLLLNYDTPLYIYIGAGLAVSLLFILCVHFIRNLIQREPKNHKEIREKKQDKLL